MPELSTIYDYMRRSRGALGRRAFCRSIQRSTNSTMQFHLGLKGCCERLSLHRPSPSWELPNAGSRRGPLWWSRSAVPARR